jgi:hypothetical protein
LAGTMGEALSAPLPGTELPATVSKTGQASTRRTNHRLSWIPQSGRRSGRKLGWKAYSKISMETFSRRIHGKASTELLYWTHEKIPLAMRMGAEALGRVSDRFVSVLFLHGSPLLSVVPFRGRAGIAFTKGCRMIPAVQCGLATDATIDGHTVSTQFLGNESLAPIHRCWFGSDISVFGGGKQGLGSWPLAGGSVGVRRLIRD